MQVCGLKGCRLKGCRLKVIRLKAEGGMAEHLFFLVRIHFSLQPSVYRPESECP